MFFQGRTIETCSSQQRDPEWGNRMFYEAISGNEAAAEALLEMFEVENLKELGAWIEEAKLHGWKATEMYRRMHE